MTTPDLDKLRSMEAEIASTETRLSQLRRALNDYLRSLPGSNANLTVKRRRLLGLCPNCGAERQGQFYCTDCTNKRTSKPGRLDNPGYLRGLLKTQGLLQSPEDIEAKRRDLLVKRAQWAARKHPQEQGIVP